MPSTVFLQLFYNDIPAALLTRLAHLSQSVMFCILCLYTSMAVQDVHR